MSRETLYAQGLNDSQIGRQIGATRLAVAAWRKKHGLKSNRKYDRLSPEAERARMALYLAGKNDREISRIEGSDRCVVGQWRRRNNLPTHNPQFVMLSVEETAARTLLYRMGRSDCHIARAVGVHFSCIRRWRVRKGFPANPDLRIRGIRCRRLHYIDTLKDRICRAVGRHLSRDIADDAVSDLYLAVLSGALDIDDVEKQARRFANRVIKQFANPYGPRSLNEQLANAEGLTRADFLTDDSQSSWLEEMGATVW